MILPGAHMRMCNTLLCLKHQVFSFVRHRFIYKLVRMVIYIVQTNAELLITKNNW